MPAHRAQRPVADAFTRSRTHCAQSSQREPVAFRYTRACWQVAVLAGTRAHSCQPFAFGCSELHRAPRVRSGAGVFPERKCVTTPCRAGPWWPRLLRGAAATADRGTTNLNKRQREKKVKGSIKGRANAHPRGRRRTQPNRAPSVAAIIAIVNSQEKACRKSSKRTVIAMRQIKST